VKSQNLQGPLKRSFTIDVLGRLPIFLAVAERRSFSAAAAELGISPSAASQAVARLEAELGVTLLVRTTRSVRTTDTGARLIEQIAPSITAACGALQAVADAATKPMGVLRLNVPRVAVRCGLRRILTAFAAEQPEVKLDITVNDHLVDIVKDGFDAGVRSRESVQKDMVVARLTGPIRFVVVGSPSYLKHHGQPKHPRDLTRHSCLGWHSLAATANYRWEFQERRREIEVAVSGPIVSNDADVLIAGALDGLGLTYVTECEVAAQIGAGQLVTVLDRFAIEVSGLFLYYPTAARKIPKLQAFVACARSALQAG
jgi:DNA-binding transcriptional LysR family regulator